MSVGFGLNTQAVKKITSSQSNNEDEDAEDKAIATDSKLSGA